MPSFTSERIILRVRRTDPKETENVEMKKEEKYENVVPTATKLAIKTYHANVFFSSDVCARMCMLF